MLINWLARASLVALITLGFLQVPTGADTSRGETEGKGAATLRLFLSPLEAAQNGRDDVRKLKLRKGEFDGAGESTKKLDDDEYAKALGFASVEEAAEADLGSSLRIYRVDVLVLEDFQKGTDPNLLLMDTHKLIFPLIVKGQPRSLLTVAELEQGQDQKKGWHTTGKGSPKKLARMINQYRTSSSNFLVEISKARLALQFLGYQKLMLTPLTDSAEFGLKAGEELPAEVVFEKLAPHAVEANKKEVYKKSRNRGKKDRAVNP